MISLLRLRVVEATFRTFEHYGNDTSQHCDSKKADLLVLGDFAEVRNAHSQIGKCTMTDNGCEVFLIEPRNDLESRADDAFCVKRMQCQVMLHQEHKCSHL